MKLPVNPIINHSVRALCVAPYPNHKKGCPNFGKKKGCPPEAPLFNDIADLSKPVYFIYTSFNLYAHKTKMKKKHPDWTERQLVCCLYWQGTARKNLKQEILKASIELPDYKINTCPEAMGIDVTATMLKRCGIILDWPPVNFTYQVAIAYKPKKGEI